MFVLEELFPVFCLVYNHRKIKYSLKLGSWVGLFAGSLGLIKKLYAGSRIRLFGCYRLTQYLSSCACFGGKSFTEALNKCAKSQNIFLCPFRVGFYILFSTCFGRGFCLSQRCRWMAQYIRVACLYLCDVIEVWWGCWVKPSFVCFMSQIGLAHRTPQSKT